MSRFVLSDEDDVVDLLAERQANRAYQRQLLQHPDPRDPDYPEPPDEDSDE